MSQKVLVGKKSSEVVRKYYGCEDPEGLLLENQVCGTLKRGTLNVHHFIVSAIISNF